MKTSFSKLVRVSGVAIVLTSFVVTGVAEAARGGGGGGGARGGGGGGGARQASNSRADVRTHDVRSTSVNNVERNVVVVDGNHRGNWDHPVAAAAIIAGAVAVGTAAVGSMVATVPPDCVPVNYGGTFYQQCGGTWYAPQGSQYVVVNPPY